MREARGGGGLPMVCGGWGVRRAFFIIIARDVYNAGVDGLDNRIGIVSGVGGTRMWSKVEWLISSPGKKSSQLILLDAVLLHVTLTSRDFPTSHLQPDRYYSILQIYFGSLSYCWNLLQHHVVL